MTAKWLRDHEWALVFALYVALVALLVPNHEPWFDEAQAWLLARDASLKDLVWFFPRYEGSPVLWHVLLRSLAANGLPYLTMTIFSAALGACGVYLLVRYSPLPRAFRYTLPFSFFLFYQYAVVARNYSLLPPLLFLAAIAYRDRWTKILSYTALLILIANVSFHAFLVAASLAALHFIEALRAWKTLGKDARRDHTVAMVGFAAVTVFLWLQLRPTADLISPPMNPHPPNFISQFFEILDNSLVGWTVPSLFVLAVSLYWFYRKKVLALYLVPTVTVNVFFTMLFAKPWHEGILFLIWIFALWQSFAPDAPPVPERERRAFGVAAGCLIAVHLYWGVKSWSWDMKNPYSGSRALAHYIQHHHLEEKKIYGTFFYSPVISPYFRKNILANYNRGKLPAFIWWSKDYSFKDTPEFIEENRPDYVIVGRMFPPGLDVKAVPSYHPVAAFPGALFAKSDIFLDDSYVLLQRNDLAPLEERAVAGKP